MKLIVGLGNPGEQYLQNRHNIGFVIIDLLLQKLNLTIKSQKFNGIFVKEKNFIIAKPLTYMNLSGNFVQEIRHYYKIKTSDILIIHDDMSFKAGEFLIKKTGSSAGQNGIQDIINKLHTQDINRIRIGIGKNPNNEFKDYVLGNFTKSEKLKIQTCLNQILQACIDFINDKDIDYLMNHYNKRAKNEITSN